MFSFAIRRHIALAVAIFALTVAGFFLARASVADDARSETRHDAEVAAVQLSDSVERASGYVDSLRQFFGRRATVTQDGFSEFADAALRPVGLLHAAWVEPVRASGRADYERAIGHRITEQGVDGRLRRARVRPVYFPATLTAVRRPPAPVALDWGNAPALRRLLDSPGRVFGVASTGPVRGPGGERGLYFAESAPRPAAMGGQRQGFVVVFVPARWLLGSPLVPAVGRRVAVTVDGVTIAATVRGDIVRRSFTGAGLRWTVLVPVRAASGAGVLLPWLILVAGAIVAVLAGGLGLSAARRAKAQDELDRIFHLSPDVIAVANFEGNFTRVNPAVEQILGYTQDEILARPYLDLIHPDDRGKTAAEAAAISHGKSTLSFENRYVCKDGSIKVLEWTSIPVVEDGVMYGVGRDVTERRRAEVELERLAGEQAALRRVATLVAHGASPMAVFDAAAAEVEGLLDAHGVLLGRYERGEDMILVAHRGAYASRLPPGTRISHQGHNVTTMVRRSARPARLKHDERAAGPLAVLVRDMGVRESIGAPIVVDGRLWGVAIANWRDQSPPPGTEERMAQFAQLLETAIANADSRDQLTASRARLLTAGDEARRRIVRDLHDGAQQRLVHTVITLGLAQRAMRQRDQEAESLVAEAVEYAQQANEQLRELSRGLLPADLTSAGLRRAVDSIVERLDLPVTVDVAPERLPAEIEANAYFIVAEALTNIVKHAGASHAAVRVFVDDGALRVELRDDGIGGADPEGHGLLGLRDRATALGGRLHVESPAGGGTLLAATLPLSCDATIEAEERAAR